MVSVLENERRGKTLRSLRKCYILKGLLFSSEAWGERLAKNLENLEWKQICMWIVYSRHLINTDFWLLGALSDLKYYYRGGVTCVLLEIRKYREAN